VQISYYVVDQKFKNRLLFIYVCNSNHYKQKKEAMKNLESLVAEASDLLMTNLQNFCEKEDLDELTPGAFSKVMDQTVQLIQAVGQLTIKRYLERHDIDEPTLQHNGQLYRKKYKQGKDFITVIGKIRVNRSVYQKDSGGKSIAPLDRKWGMEHEYMSAKVQEGILHACNNNTPTEVEQIIKKIAMYYVSPSAIKNLVRVNGKIIEENKSELMDRIYDKEELVDSPPDVMVASFDGVNVLLNEKGKKKGRPKERPDKSKSALSISSYKNATCGSVSFYNIDIQEDTGKKKPRRLMTNYVSRMPEDRYTTFKHDFEKEISHCSRSNPGVKIMLTDAHTSIQGYIKDNPFYKDFIWLIDFYHAAEHLSKLAELLFGKSNEKGRKWYSEKRHILKHSEDGPNKVIRSAEYYIKKNIRSKKKRKEAIRELNYFKKHKKLMNYKTHIDNGWPIGSGVIEAACKSLVKQRMCRSGQRWSRKGGQNILHLRTFVKSGRWDNFWDSYLDLKYSKKCA